MIPSRSPGERDAQAGFTYIGVLILLAIIALTATGGLQVGAVMQRRAAEESLLDIGGEFRAALKSYAKATPAGLPTAPRSLQDLLRDPRFPNPVRHLRKVYFDPMTGKQDWALVFSPDGMGILGIHSRSTGRPIKIGNFPPAYQSFQDSKSYAEWIFALPPAVPTVPVATPAPASAK
jgi:type II secretory pathway pseudopilin PulG